MTKSRVVIAVHANWAVQRRQPLIDVDQENLIREVICWQLARLRCPFIAFGAAPDHVHVLFLLRSMCSCEHVLRALKSASVAALHRRSDQAFRWQQGYGVFSVSRPLIPTATTYVLNQRRHHADGTTIAAYE
jgi:putative transposase